MRLALVTGEFPPQQGGVGDYTRELATEFARRGLRVQVITSSSGRPLPSSPPQRGEGAQPPSLLQEEGRGEGESDNIQYTRFASWLSLVQVDRLTRACDLVHVQYQAAAYGMTPPIHMLPRYLRWRNPRRKIVVTFHDLKIPYLFPKAGPLRWRAVLFLARTCDAVVVTNQEDFITLSNPKSQPRLSCVARFARRALQVLCGLLRSPPVGDGRHRKGRDTGLARGERLPTSNLHAPISNLQSPISNLHLIPIGSNIAVDLSAPIDRTAVRASLGVSPYETLLCYFGFLNASKGGETLVRLLADVARAGYNPRLLMLGGEVGASDPTNVAYAERVKALMNELDVAARVIWAGYRPPGQVTALWRASDIAVLPYADGASLRRGTLMAAFAHALPIVSTTPRVSVPPLRDGENIALAPPEDADALAAKVIALIASPALRERLSQGAAQLAREFTWPRIVDQHLELYRTRARA